MLKAHIDMQSQQGTRILDSRVLDVRHVDVSLKHSNSTYNIYINMGVCIIRVDNGLFVTILVLIKYTIIFLRIAHLNFIHPLISIFYKVSIMIF